MTAASSTRPAIGCIVEGAGEESAIRLLVQRIAAEVLPSSYVDVMLGKRVPRSTLVKAGGIESAVEQTARSVGPHNPILVLIDADDDCPATLGPSLLKRAQAARSDRLIGVVLAKYEYEAWFLAAAASLRGQHGLPTDLQPPDKPEAIRGAKEWLRDRLPKGQRYRETVHQPAFTAIFDLASARAGADSFDKCYREIERLITALTDPLP